MSGVSKYPLAILDCSNLGYMAAYTTGGMSYGQIPTGVIFGFLNQIFKFAKDHGPHEFVFCWDSRTSFRRQAYPEYKRRVKRDNDGIDYDSIFWQFDELRTNVLPAMGWRGRSYLREGYEADDLIAWVSGQTRKADIISGDNDLYQLLDSQYIRIYQPRKDQFYSEKDFVDEYGIHPSQWVEVKAIAGCASDTLPGVKGVGEKTAIKWLKGNLKPESKAAQSIQSSTDIVKRNRPLVRLPYGDGWPEFILSPVRLRRQGFYEVFKKYGFEQFIRRLSELTMVMGVE